MTCRKITKVPSLRFKNITWILFFSIKTKKERNLHTHKCELELFPVQSSFSAVLSRIPDGRSARLADPVRRTVCPSSIPPHFDQIFAEDVAGSQRRYQIVEFAFVAVDVQAVGAAVLAVLSVADGQSFRHPIEHRLFARLAINRPFTKLISMSLN